MNWEAEHPAHWMNLSVTAMGVAAILAAISTDSWSTAVWSIVGLIFVVISAIGFYGTVRAQ